MQMKVWMRWGGQDHVWTLDLLSVSCRVLIIAGLTRGESVGGARIEGRRGGGGLVSDGSLLAGPPGVSSCRCDL